VWSCCWLVMSPLLPLKLRCSLRVMVSVRAWGGVGPLNWQRDISGAGGASEPVAHHYARPHDFYLDPAASRRE
jgi:hypothetical protein